MTFSTARSSKSRVVDRPPQARRTNDRPIGSATSASPRRSTTHIPHEANKKSLVSQAASNLRHTAFSFEKLTVVVFLYQHRCYCNCRARRYSHRRRNNKQGTRTSFLLFLFWPALNSIVPFQILLLLHLHPHHVQNPTIEIPSCLLWPAQKWGKKYKKYKFVNDDCVHYYYYIGGLLAYFLNIEALSVLCAHRFAVSLVSIFIGKHWSSQMIIDWLAVCFASSLFQQQQLPGTVFENSVAFYFLVAM